LHDSAVDAAATIASGPETQDPVKTGVMSKIKSCANWLMYYVPDYKETCNNENINMFYKQIMGQNS